MYLFLLKSKLNNFFTRIPGQLCTLHDLLCNTWRLLTLIIRSRIPPPQVLSHCVNPVVNTWSRDKIGMFIVKLILLRSGDFLLKFTIKFCAIWRQREDQDLLSFTLFAITREGLGGPKWGFILTFYPLLPELNLIARTFQTLHLIFVIFIWKVLRVVAITKNQRPVTSTANYHCPFFLLVMDKLAEIDLCKY